MRFRDKVAIGTGSTSGIGRTTAQRFVEEGARVLVAGLEEADGETAGVGLRKLAARQGAGNALFVHADLADPGAVRSGSWMRRFHTSAIDVVVDNAAMTTFDPIAPLDEAAWDRLYAVKLHAPFAVVRQRGQPEHGPAGALRP